MEVATVTPNSIAAQIGIEPGDRVVAAGGTRMRDLIDFTFACADDDLELVLIKKDGTEQRIRIKKNWDQDLGLSFASATADGIRRCRNRCLFCFVDQMPRGLRRTLYVKDDDWRLSVLQGNFVTLTNLSAADLERITRLHLSPLYVSVHTLNGDLRQKLMRNKRAGEIRHQLETLAAAGIEMHCQIVLCPGLNDGKELENTVRGLAELWPAVASVAAVPVGLTRYRDGLAALRPFTRAEAGALIAWAKEEQQRFRDTLGCSFFHLGDEFYVLAGEEVPGTECYDAYPQLENGVGLIRRFLDDLAALPAPPPSLPGKRFTLVTGTAAGPTVQKLGAWWNSFPGWQAEIKTITNSFWGPTVTAAGLLTGEDILAALEGVEDAGLVFLPSAMFSPEGLALDGWSLTRLEQRLGLELKTAALPRDIWSELVLGGEQHDCETACSHSRPA